MPGVDLHTRTADPAAATLPVSLHHLPRLPGAAHALQHGRRETGITLHTLNTHPHTHRHTHTNHEVAHKQTHKTKHNNAFSHTGAAQNCAHMHTLITTHTHTQTSIYPPHTQSLTSRLIQQPPATNKHLWQFSEPYITLLLHTSTSW